MRARLTRIDKFFVPAGTLLCQFVFLSLQKLCYASKNIA